MANEIQTASSTTPGDETNWQAELNLTELARKGYDGISLTEWAAGDTDKPQIAAGSVIEIDGAIAKFTNQTALTDEGGLADGWCYIKFVVSGSDVVPTLTNTFGTWDTAKQGFYATNDRYSLHAMYRSGAVTKIFALKGTFVNTPNASPYLINFLDGGRSNLTLQNIKQTVYTGTITLPAAGENSCTISCTIPSANIYSMSGFVYSSGSGGLGWTWEYQADGGAGGIRKRDLLNTITASRFFTAPSVDFDGYELRVVVTHT